MTCDICQTDYEPTKPNQKGCGKAKCRKERYRRAHATTEQPESRALVPEVDDDAPGKVGAPIKLTPAVQKIVCQMVRKGNYLNAACAAAGISADSLSRWRKQGAAGQEPFATFLRELQQAELDCETALVKKWHDAAPDDWRAARDLLARRFPDRWGREVEEAPAMEAGSAFRSCCIWGARGMTGPKDVTRSRQSAKIPRGRSRAPRPGRKSSACAFFSWRLGVSSRSNVLRR